MTELIGLYYWLGGDNLAIALFVVAVAFGLAGLKKKKRGGPSPR